MKRRVSFGLALSLIGISMFLVSSIPITRTDEAIDTYFTLSPGGVRGPYDDDTCYHTRVLVKSVLSGVITVEGGGIRVTTSGYNAEDLGGLYIEGERSFMIAPAKDQYTFTFDNTEGNTECSVRFVLTEIWTGSISPLVQILGVAGLIFLVPSGLAISGLLHLIPEKSRSQVG
ncbi:MAG: hypothetical protein JSV18_06035 [Candidatus Bathyarchaeota archaeon]|nr:MAG: hypothetical protein JSV18_06035 [Candidatus Bathyarchaeota archaeon]